MAGRAILQLGNGKQIREQNLQSTLSRGSNATQETRAHHIGAVNTYGSRMPPSPMFAALHGVVETRSIEIVDQTMKMSCNDVHAPGTIFKRHAAGSAQYPFGEGTSMSRPPLPLPKRMRTETSPRREDIPFAMQTGKFVESSLSTYLATKAVEMESQSLTYCVNVGSSSQHDACSSRSNYTGRLLRANVERPKPKSNLTINLNCIDDGPIADRDTNVMRLKLDDIDDCPSTHAWSKRWLFNGGKVVKKTEGMGPPNDGEQRRPSIAAMAMMGRAFLNGYEKPCAVQKRGAVTVWKT